MLLETVRNFSDEFKGVDKKDKQGETLASFLQLTERHTLLKKERKMHLELKEAENTLVDNIRTTQQDLYVQKINTVQL